MERGFCCIYKGLTEGLITFFGTDTVLLGEVLDSYDSIAHGFSNLELRAQSIERRAKKKREKYGTLSSPLYSLRSYTGLQSKVN